MTRPRCLKTIVGAWTLLFASAAAALPPADNVAQKKEADPARAASGRGGAQ